MLNSPFANLLTKESLINDYHKLRLTKAEIARKYGCTTITVYRYMKRFSISAIKPIERTKDLTGVKFGRLTVLRRGSLDNHGKTRWICKCECGEERTINTSSLIRGLTISCGCWNSEKNRTGYGDISGSYWRRIETSAANRELDFSITPEYVWAIYLKQSRRCALVGLPIAFLPNYNHGAEQTASIDRIDSNKGYVVGNIQVVHKVVNMIKGWLSQEEFTAMCNLVAEAHPMLSNEALAAFTIRTFRKNNHV